MNMTKEVSRLWWRVFCDRELHRTKRKFCIGAAVSHGRAILWSAPRLDCNKIRPMSLQHNILSQTWTIASNVSCWACGLGFGAEYDYEQHKYNVATLVSLLIWYCCYGGHWCREDKNENADVCGTSAAPNDSGGRQWQVCWGPNSYYGHFIQVCIITWKVFITFVCFFIGPS